MIKAFILRVQKSISYRYGRFNYTFFIQKKGILGINFVSKFIKFVSSILVKFVSKKYYSVIDLSSKNPHLYSKLNYNEYKDYLSTQIIGNDFKKNNQAVNEEDIEIISVFLKNKFNNIALSGICHGTRGGYEQNFFLKYLPTNTKVIGTEIGNNSEKIENTVNWDFNIENKEWIKKFDFIYSNSHDHSYDLEKTLKIWAKTLKKDGYLFLDHMWSHGNLLQNYLDPSSLETEYLPFQLLKWKDINIYVECILTPYGRKGENLRNQIFCIKKNG